MTQNQRMVSALIYTNSPSPYCTYLPKCYRALIFYCYVLKHNGGIHQRHCGSLPKRKRRTVRYSSNALEEEERRWVFLFYFLFFPFEINRRSILIHCNLYQHPCLVHSKDHFMGLMLLLFNKLSKYHDVKEAFLNIFSIV